MYMEHEYAGISERSPAEAEISRKNRPEIILQDVRNSTGSMRR